jgi:hypothetical protein
MTDSVTKQMEMIKDAVKKAKTPDLKKQGAKKFISTKGEITVSRDGLAWRDGKVLGRRNWIVQTETSLTSKQEYIIKAINREEAEEKAISMSETRYKRYNGVYTEVTACWCPNEDG